MTIRFYVLPIERNAAGTTRGPKYFKWRDDPDPPALVQAPWSMKDYGSIDYAILCTDILAADHTALAANADVLAPPVNIDSTMTQGAVNQAKTFLEAFNIPANWVNAGDTYRAVLRTVTGMFLFMQRVTAILGREINFTQVSLSTQVNDLPADVRAALAQAASELGYDYSAVTGTTTLRQILKFMADAWGSAPIYFGLATL